MATMQRIVPCLWFDTQAQDAARFYVSIFADSEIISTAYYGKAGFEIHGRPEGSVMTVSFRILGQELTALNGGPVFQFNEAISFQVFCADQAELDRLWARLTEGGSEQPCGWLKDRYGLSWQIVPEELPQMMADPARAERVMAAFLPMKKLDIATLRRAYQSV